MARGEERLLLPDEVENVTGLQRRSFVGRVPVMSCVTPATVISLAKAVRCCFALARALGEAWPKGTCRGGTLIARAFPGEDRR